ncbi:MAG: PEP-CTERM sorting domain-containing protein [Bryobacteraceae bacterium]
MSLLTRVHIIALALCIPASAARISVASCSAQVRELNGSQPGKFIGQKTRYGSNSCLAEVGGLEITAGFQGQLSNARIFTQIQDPNDVYYNFSAYAGAFLGDFLLFKAPEHQSGFLRITTSYASRRNAGINLSWSDKESPFSIFTDDVPIQFGMPVFLGLSASAFSSARGASRAAGGFDAIAETWIQEMQVLDAARTPLSDFDWSSRARWNYPVVGGEQVVANPEPGTYLLTASALVAVLLLRKRLRRV